SEGRSYLTVGVGCTGGRHPTVVLADLLASALRDKLGLAIDVVHRDIARVNLAGPEGDPDHGPRSVQGGHES
ncbi:MAG TPA: RNase adapter RapZ, partial [Polyangiaceae bacterium]|nr:RNase adapter RapZ [Polyangiaceae bacterium]